MEDRITIGQFTEMDKNIDTLADVLSSCKLKRYKKTCGPCENCETKRNFEMCYDALSVCGKLRVSKMAEDRFVTEAAWYKHKKDKDRDGTYTIIVILAPFIVAAVMAIVSLASAHGEEYPSYTRHEMMIRETLERTHSQVKDRDGDGKVNCVDWTMTFKLEWDKKYPGKNCEIVYNCNPRTNAFAHLFIMCRESERSGWKYVEPQAKPDEDFRPMVFWNSSFVRKGYGPGYSRVYGYDPAGDRYGQTAYWMSRCKVRD